MGAVESTAEENSIIRFVDSVEIRHEKDTSSLTQEHGFADYVPESKGKEITDAIFVILQIMLRNVYQIYKMV